MSRALGCLLALFTVPFTAGLVVVSVAWLDSGTVSATRTTTVLAGPAPHVIVHLTGGLDVGAGSPGEVVLREQDTERGWVRSSFVPAFARMRADRGTVTVDVPAELGGATGLPVPGRLGVDRALKLMVPSDATLQIDGNAGFVELHQLAIPVRLSITNGAVNLDRYEVAGSSSFTLTRGAINGTIDMAGGSLAGTLSLGVINLRVGAFDGTRLQATSSNGNLSLPDAAGLTRQRLGSSNSASGVAGGGAETSGELTLDVDNGVINLT